MQLLMQEIIIVSAAVLQTYFVKRVMIGSLKGKPSRGSRQTDPLFVPPKCSTFQEATRSSGLTCFWMIGAMMGFSHVSVG